MWVSVKILDFFGEVAKATVSNHITHATATIPEKRRSIRGQCPPKFFCAPPKFVPRKYYFENL